MADDIPVDLFGDDDEDEDEEGEGFGYAEEDFVEVGADTPLAAEVANLKRPVWLAKVPKGLWEHVVAASASGQDVGELVVKREAGGRQTLSLRLAAPPNQADLAGEYALASAPKGRAYVFAEAENNVSFEGTVAEQYNAIPRQARPFTAAWAAAAEDEKVTANVISVADEMAGPLDTIGQAREVSKARRLRRGNALQEMRAREANMADRHERLPEEQVQSMLFDLFARQQYWTFRDLVDKTNQPAAHLKKILTDVAIFHASGPAHNMYELKPEFGGRS